MSINLPEKPNYPQIEEDILKYWNEIDAFKTQLKKSEKYPKYSFFDGPPFATGLPHYGHIAAGTIKDVITRYATMKGNYVERRFGWDCHGLPVEFEIDQLLGIKTKVDAQKIGVQKYNEECRKIVMRYSKDWERIITRFGRWIDFENDYKTMNIDFMESVWWVFKQIFDKGLVYKGCKIMPYSNGCTTVLSNFEANLNYKDCFDPSIHCYFPLENDPDVSFIAWTTTPWTLPSNLALCVNPKFDYVKIKDLKLKRIFIVAECRLGDLYKSAKKNPNENDNNKNKKKKKNKKKGKHNKENLIEVVEEENNDKNEEEEKEFEILEKMKGIDLKGISYIPLFDYYSELKENGCFRILCDEYVSADAGTGVVHQSPAYGEDDYRVCTDNKIIQPDKPIITVDESGLFIDKVSDFKGMNIKEADKLIIKHLKEKNRVHKVSQIKHSYPFCWRSETPLIYKAVDAWFIKVTDIKEDLIKNNLKAYWVPSSIQEKKFNNWLENACDWCFSRNRFWGNPIPIWVSDDYEEVVCISSIEELERLSGEKVTDLHRESIDHITIESKKGKGKLKRVEEVFDCWFESGSMPYASYGYPFNKSEEDFSKIFPADFIGEGIDQTRGWFYTLNVIATCLKNVNPYKNLIVNGLVLAKDGTKMSKRKQNYPDPVEMANKFGADSVRLYLMNSPLVKAENLKFNEAGLLDIIKDVFNPWYNVFKFLLQNINRWEIKNNTQYVYDENYFNKDFKNVLDRWILASSHNLIKFVKKEIDSYRLYTVLDKKVKFLVSLSNWYLRLNRGRVKGDFGDEDCLDSINVLFNVILNSSILMAPYIPFLTDYFYSNLKNYIKEDVREGSIHFLLLPEFNEKYIDEKLIDIVELMQRIINNARKIREDNKIDKKQPLQSILIVHKDNEFIEKIKSVEKYIKEEINVLNVNYSNEYKEYMKYKLIPNHKLLGEKYGSQYDKIRPNLMKLNNDDAEFFIKNKSITVDEIVFDENCFTLKAEFINQKDKNLKIGGQIDFSIVLNLEMNDNLVKLGLVRKVTNKIQTLRKEKKLNLNDKIVILYDIKTNKLKEAIEENVNFIKNTLKKPFFVDNNDFELNNVVANENYKIQNEEFNIRITSEFIHLNEKNIKDKISNEDYKNLSSFIKNLNINELKVKDELKYNFNNKELVLKKGVDFELIA